MVDTLEALIGDEVWLYHKKVVTKDAESFQPEPEDAIGGKSSNAWAWHQDYGVRRTPYLPPIGPNIPLLHPHSINCSKRLFPAALWR